MDGQKIVLIGMDGAVKSALGRILARRLGLGFVDIDDLIRSEAKGELRDVNGRRGTSAPGRRS